MIRFFVFLFFSFSVLAVYSPTAIAAEPDKTVKTLYAEYKKALGDKDYTNAYFIAGKVWKAAEEKYGDSRQTGDLAYNYAVLGKARARGNRNKRTEKAFERSIELVHFHEGNFAKTSLKRHLYYAVYQLDIGKRKKAAALLTAGETIAQTANISGTKDYALLMYHQAKSAYQIKKYPEAKVYIDKTLQIFETLGHEKTKAAYQAEFVKADINAKLDNWRAAIAGYEKIYVNLDRDLDMKDQMIGRAYLKEGMLARHIRSRKKNSGEDRRAALSCKGCWPNFDPKWGANLIKDDNYDIDRYPPNMPSDAMSSAFVIIMYDTDNKGKPVNLRIIGASHSKTFDAATAAAIKRWHVYEQGSKHPAKNVKDLVTSMRFYLADRRGQILDFYGVSIKD